MLKMFLVAYIGWSLYGGIKYLLSSYAFRTAEVDEAIITYDTIKPVRRVILTIFAIAITIGFLAILRINSYISQPVTLSFGLTYIFFMMIETLTYEQYFRFNRFVFIAQKIGIGAEIWLYIFVLTKIIRNVPV